MEAVSKNPVVSLDPLETWTQYCAFYNTVQINSYKMYIVRNRVARVCLKSNTITSITFSMTSHSNSIKQFCTKKIAPENQFNFSSNRPNPHSIQIKRNLFFNNSNSFWPAEPFFKDFSASCKVFHWVFSTLRTTFYVFSQSYHKTSRWLWQLSPNYYKKYIFKFSHKIFWTLMIQTCRVNVVWTLFSLISKQKRVSESSGSCFVQTFIYTS